MEPDPTAFSPGSSRAGLNRIRFLLESLSDLDTSLKKLGSRLLVLKGEVLIRCLKEVVIFLTNLNNVQVSARNVIFVLISRHLGIAVAN